MAGAKLEATLGRRQPELYGTVSAADLETMRPDSFEGGAVVTNDDTLAEKIRLMRNFGFAGYDRVTYIGTNGKMSEVAAAGRGIDVRSLLLRFLLVPEAPASLVALGRRACAQARSCAFTGR